MKPSPIHFSPLTFQASILHAGPPNLQAQALGLFFGCSPARETPHPRPPAREISAKGARDPKLKKMDINGIKMLDIFASFLRRIS